MESFLAPLESHRPRGGERMRPYEGMFIFKPTLEEEARTNLIEKLKSVITSFGEVTEEEDWGNRKLAYEIEDFKEAYYYLVRFNAKNGVNQEINRQVRITESILRHLVIRLDEK